MDLFNERSFIDSCYEIHVPFVFTNDELIKINGYLFLYYELIKIDPTLFL